MLGYNSQRRGIARTLPKLIVLFWVLFVCKRVLYYGHRVSTHLQIILFFFKKRFIAQKINEIHMVTKLRNCSFNQFTLVVPRRASDRECTVLGSYEYSSEKQVQRKNTADVATKCPSCDAVFTLCVQHTF